MHGVVLSPALTPSLPAERCLISSLTQGLGCGQTGMGQRQPIIRLGAQRDGPGGSSSRLSGTVTHSRHPSGTPSPLNPKVQSTGSEVTLLVEGTRKLTRATPKSGIPSSAETSPLGCCSWARQGPLLGRREEWALGFSPFKAQIAEIEEIPGQAERSFKQTLYNRL